MNNILKFENVKIFINIIIIIIIIYEFYRQFIAKTAFTNKSRRFIKTQLQDKWALTVISIMISLVIIIHIYHYFYPSNMSIEKYKRGLTFGFIAWLVSCFSAMGYTITLFYIVAFCFIFFNFRLV